MTKEMTKNMIFDIQRFDAENETVTASSSADSINIGYTTDHVTVKYKVGGTGAEKDLLVKTDGNVIKGISGGSGADTIFVAADENVTGLDIYGGKGNDLIQISTDTAAASNTYVYNVGEGKDTIEGWKNDDVLQLPEGTTYSTLMSANGDDFIIQVGSGNITFKDLGKENLAYNDRIVKIKVGDGAATDTKVLRLMQGTTKSETFNNVYVSATETAKTGTAANAMYTIDGGSGNDTITNDANFVYVTAGAGNDKIFIKADGTPSTGTITNGVIVNAGLGNDTIDVSSDTVAGAVAGHTFEYSFGDGKDVIIGYSSSDTIKINVSLTEEGFDSDSFITALNASDVDVNGNYIININSRYTSYDEATSTTSVTSSSAGTITIKDAVGGTALHFVDKTGTAFDVEGLVDEIPKKKKYSTGGTLIEDATNTALAGYTFDANSGNDTIKVEIASANIWGGAGNDVIILASGTNIANSSTDADVASSVTIFGGAGNDSINAISDTKTVSGETGRATHVYQYGLSDGRDTIVGFNASDTVMIATSDPSKVKADFDASGKNYVLSFGSTSVTFILDERYKRGDKLNVKILNSNEDAYIDLESNTSFTGYVPKILRGTTGSDSTAERRLVNAYTNDNFTIQGLAGNDSIENHAASNVYIDAGAGNDTISLFSDSNVTGSYGQDVTIEGGYGNDLIIAESVSGAEATTDTSIVKYYFGANDGNDTIKYFGTDDEIILKDGSQLLGYEAKGDNFILKIGATGSNVITATITLVDRNKDKEHPILIEGDDLEIPKEIKGTTGNDTALKSLNDGYLIEALAGNDSIQIAHNEVIAKGDAGNDTIAVITGKQDAYVYGGDGNDYVSIEAGAQATVEVGAGNDTVALASSGGGNVYRFGSGEGTNYILNFQDGDSFRIKDGLEFNAEMTEAGYVLNVGSTRVYVKGGLKAGDEHTDTTVLANYDNLVGETALQVIRENVVTENQETGATETSNVAYDLMVPSQIVGKAIADDITNDKDDYEIDAKAGNDTIFNSGNKVTVKAGLGNDTITLGSDSASVEVYGNAGNDVIYGSEGGNVYHYNYGDGNDTIFGFTGQDTLDIQGATYTYASVTTDGFEVKVGSNRILLKGQKFEGKADTDTAFADFDNINPDDVPVINIKNGDTLKPVKVEKLVLGTTGANNISNSLEGYEIYALGGNDVIVNSGTGVYIDAGAGNDVVTIASDAENVTVNTGVGNDSIVARNQANVYQFALGDGVNTIFGLTDEDTIHITSGDIKSGAFDANDFYVLTLSDNRTKILLKGAYISGSDKKLNGSSFNLKLGDAMPTTYDIANEIKITDTTEHTFSDTSAHHNAVIIGDNKANVIKLNGANNVSIGAGIGNDSIRVESGADATIAGGAGNDTIELEQHGQIVRYAKGDGNDVIVGWTNDDTLEFVGDISTPTTQLSGNDFILKVGANTITFKNAAADSIINVAGMTGIVVPKLIKGTTGDDKYKGVGTDTSLINTGDEYTIEAYAGADTINNSGTSVYIDAGSGNDTINNAGYMATIFGDSGNDVINNLGEKASINAGASHDIVSLAGESAYNTIMGGKGDDTIFGNNGQNVYQYNSGDGNDLILGFTATDTLLLNGVTVKSGAMTADGYVIAFTNNASLTLKGSRMINPESGEEVAGTDSSVFDFIPGGTALNILSYDTESEEYKVLDEPLTVPNEKMVTKNQALYNADGDYTLTGTGSQDTIFNAGEYNTINGGGGNDLIMNNGAYAYINGGDGNDIVIMNTNGYNHYNTDTVASSITIAETTYNVNGNDDGAAGSTTIRGGAGDDTIYGNDNGHVYQYASGDGKDVIVNFTSADTIDVIGGLSYSTLKAINTTKVVGGETVDNPEYKDFVVKVGTGTITLKNVAVDTTIHFSDGETLKVERVHVMGDEETEFTNTWESYYIEGNDGNNTITNLQSDEHVASAVTINAGGGNNTINNDGEDAYIISVEKASKVVNSETGTGAVIFTGAESDTILNRADMVYIDAGDGDNVITNLGGLGTINSGNGNDVIINGTDTATADGSIILSGDGSDDITNFSADVFINADAGSDTIRIKSTSNGNTIYGGAGNDTIYNEGTANTYVFTSDDGDDIISGFANGSDNIKLDLKDGETYDYEQTSEGYVITIYDENNVAKATLTLTNIVGGKRTPLAGDTEITIKDKNGNTQETFNTPLVLLGTENSETLVLESGNEDYTIKALAGDDIIKNGSDQVTIDAGAGNDTIYNTGTSVYILGGDGNDSILMGMSDTGFTFANPSDVIVNGGAGNDTLIGSSNTSHNPFTFEYAPGDGDDVIVNYSETDIIKINGSYSYTVSAGDAATSETASFILNVGDGSIKLRNYGSGRVQIMDADENTSYITIPTIVQVPTTSSTKVVGTSPDTSTVTVPAYYLENTTDNAIISGSGSPDTIDNNAQDVLIYAGAGADSIRVANKSGVIVVAGAGNDTITSTENDHEGILYQFKTGENSNIIENFSSNDTIQVADGSEFSTVISSPGAGQINNVVVTIGTTSINLKSFGVGENVLNIVDSEGTLHEIEIPNLVPGTDDPESLDAIGDSYLVQGLAGNDTLNNSGVGDDETGYGYVTLDGGAGNDRFINSGANVLIIDDTAGQRVGNDLIYLNEGSNNATVDVYGGSNTIYNNDASNSHFYMIGSISGGNTIYNFNAAKDTIVVKDGSTVAEITASSYLNSILTLNIGGATVALNGVRPGDAIKVVSINDTKTQLTDAAGNAIKVPLVLNGTDAADTLENGTVNYYINAFAGNDRINNTATNVTINAGDGNDTVNNSGTAVFVEAGAGVDRIFNYADASDTSINAGAGNDLIYNYADNVTVNPGAGADQIFNYNDTTDEDRKGNVYQFGYKEGSAVIYGFDTASDTLYFSTTTTAPTSENLQLSFDRRTITLVQDQTTVILYKASDPADTDTKFAFTDGINIRTADETNSDVTLTPNAILVGTGGNDTLENTQSDLTIYAYAGDDSITNTAKAVLIDATGGGNNILVNTASGVTGSDTAVSLLAGEGNDTISDSSAYTHINVTGGANRVNLSGTYADLTLGAGKDSVTVSGSAGGNNTIRGGAAIDTIVLSGNAAGNVIHAGVGNDLITSNGKGNSFFYVSDTNEGTDQYTNFSIVNDKFLVETSNTAVTATTDGTNTTVSMVTGRRASYAVLLGITSGSVRYEALDNAGTVKTVTIGSQSRIAEDNVPVLNDLLDDDNFMTDDAQISSITEITADNYSAGNIESLNLENLAQSGYVPSATYGTDKKQE